MTAHRHPGRVVGGLTGPTAAAGSPTPAWWLVWLAAALGLGGCTAARLRREQSDARVPAALATTRAQVERAQLAGDDAPPKRSTAEALNEQLVDTRLAPDDLGFLGLSIHAERWATLAPGGAPLPVRMSESVARSAFLARSEPLRAAWQKRVGAAHRYSQALGLRRLVEQYNAFSRMPDGHSKASLLPTPESLEGAVVSADVELEQVAFEERAFELLLGLTETFHQLRYQVRAVKVLSESVGLARRLSSAAEARYATSGSSGADVLRAQMAQDNAERLLTTAREQREALRAVLGAQLDAPQALDAGSATRLPPLPPLAALRPVAATHSLEVRATAARLARGQAMLNLAERTIIPDLQVGLSATGGSAPAAAARPQYGAGSAWLAELRDRVEGDAHALVQARARAPADAERAHARLSDALRRVTLYRGALVPRARKVLSAVEAQYRLGRAGYSELDDAFELWLNTGLGQHAAVRDAHIAAAALERLLGMSLASVSAADGGAPSNNLHTTGE